MVGRREEETRCRECPVAKISKHSVRDTVCSFDEKTNLYSTIVRRCSKAHFTLQKEGVFRDGVSVCCGTVRS